MVNPDFSEIFNMNKYIITVPQVYSGLILHHFSRVEKNCFFLESYILLLSKSQLFT